MSYQTFRKHYNCCEIKKPDYISNDKAFPKDKIFASMDIAANKELLDSQKKRCDVAFVSELPDNITLSIFIEKKGAHPSHTEVEKQFEDTIQQMDCQGIFDAIGQEKIILVLCAKNPLSKKKRLECAKGMQISLSNGKSNKVPILCKSSVKNKNPTLWKEACDKAKTF